MKKLSSTWLKAVIIAVSVGVGFIIRLLYCICYPVPVRDAFSYQKIIEEWNETGILPDTEAYPPLGLFLLKAPSSLFSIDTIKGGVIVNMLLGLGIIILSICISYQIIRSHFVVGLVGLIVATHPTLVGYSCQLLRENSYLFFCDFSILFAIRFYKDKRIPNLLGTAFFSAAAFLCRHEAIEMLLFYSIFILLWNKEELKRRMINCTVLFTFFFLTCISISYAIGVPLEYYKSYTEKYTKKEKSEIVQQFTPELSITDP